MALNLRDLPVALAYDFDEWGGLAIIDPRTRKRLKPQQVVDAYNTIALELAKRIQSDVD